MRKSIIHSGVSTSRRTALKQLCAGLASTQLAGCSLVDNLFSEHVDAYRRNGIDVHCHVFNATDIPAGPFVERVVLREYEDTIILPGEPLPEESLTSKIAKLLIEILQQSSITASEEYSQLVSGTTIATTPEEKNRKNEDIVTEIFTSYSGDRFSRDINTPPPLPGESNDIESILLLDLPNELKEQNLLGQEESITLDLLIAGSLLSNGYIGRNVRWALNLLQSRYEIICDLLDLYGNEGGINLFTPAMVDFSYWLDGDPVSPFSDQVSVMDLLHRKFAGPSLVHGFVSFNPLHQVLHELENSTAEEPLALVNRAVMESGFIGVKLYPPMGYLPIDNDKYEMRIPQRLEGITGIRGEIDTALKKLYYWCATNGVPILAHGANSNAPMDDAGNRANPLFWKNVFTQFPGLKVNIGHFGGFEEFFKSRDAKTWETTIGEMYSGGEKTLTADMSYISELLGQNASATERKDIENLLREYIDAFDGNAESLMYASDWNMLGREPEHELYIEKLENLLKKIGLDVIQIENVYFNNAVRYLGLKQGEKTRVRLEQYSNKHGLDSQRYSIFD